MTISPTNEIASRTEFENFTQKVFLPRIHEWQAALRSIRVKAWLLVLACVFALLIFGDKGFYFMLSVFVLASIFWTHSLKRIKNEMIDCFLDGLHLKRESPTAKIIEPILKKNRLFRSGYSTISFDTAFSGIFQKTPFSVTEVCLKRIHRSGKHTHVSVIFNGILVRIALKRPQQAHTIISSKAFVRDWISSSYDLPSVEIEDPAFMEKYNIYSKDQIAARVLLTPRVLEELYVLKNFFPNADIQISFLEQGAVLAINTGDLFEPFKGCGIDGFSLRFLFQTPDLSNYLKFYDEIERVVNLIDVLNDCA